MKIQFTLEIYEYKSNDKNKTNVLMIEPAEVFYVKRFS